MKKHWTERAAQMMGDMIIFAMQNKQTVGEKRDYYLTIEQIEKFLIKLTK